MTITLKKIALAKQPDVSEGRLVTDNYLDVIGNIEVSCLVRLGTFTMTISELRQLKQGQIVPLKQKTYEPVDILLNNQVIARGELMSCDEHFAIQITEVHS